MPTQLTPDEARVLGVLVEKELTTPDQYPLTLNAVVNGANQRNNRDPVTAITDDQARSALISLRAKGLAVQLDGHGSRTSKFRHEMSAKLGVNKAELVILAELLLRGPQTQGELRGRASRMHPLESLELVRNMLTQLMTRPEPLVKELPPSPGSRAERYAQLLCPFTGSTAEGEGSVESDGSSATAAPTAVAAVQAASAPASNDPALVDRVIALEAEVVALRTALRHLATQLGAEDPLGPPEGGPH